MLMSRCCCVYPQYCITTAKFFACSDVTGFTAKWYQNWTSGTTPPGSPEATETVSTVPHCYSPASTTLPYSVMIEKTGWITMIVRLPAVNTATVNFTLGMAPTTLAITHDRGSGTLAANVASPVVGFTVGASYDGCFTGTDSVTCNSSDPCPGPSSGTIAFKFHVQAGAAGCNGASLVSCSQTSTSSLCVGGATFSPGHCSGTSIVSDCPLGGGTYALFGQTTVTSCGTPFNVTIAFTRGGACDTSPTRKVASSSVTLTY